MKVALEASCPGDHNHVPLEGNIPGGGGPRSKAAESYPQALAEALANSMMVPTDGDIVMAAEDADSAGALDLAQGDLDLSPEVPQQGALDLDLAPEPSENVTKNKTLKAEVGSQVFSYVARLHKNLGHPSPEVLQRMLTEVQATADVLKAAKEYICPKCHERKPPAGVPPASGLTARTFGDRLMADTTWIDTDDGRLCVMVMMDHATRYVALRIMKSERSVDLVKGLERGWSNIPLCQRSCGSMRPKVLQLNIFVNGALNMELPLKLLLRKLTTGLVQLSADIKWSAEHLSSTWMRRANAPRRLCLKLPSTALDRSTT
jgi:hypothetical protein